MKIKRDRFYLYIGYVHSETKWTASLDISKPSYLWVLADIGIFWRKLVITFRAGKCQILRRRTFSGDSSGNATKHSYKPVTFDGDGWADWELE